MSTPNRLYVPGILRPGEHLSLDGESARYVARVLRLRAGDALLVFDGRGGEHRAIVARASRADVVLKVRRESISALRWRSCPATGRCSASRHVRFGVMGGSTG